MKKLTHLAGIAALLATRLAAQGNMVDNVKNACIALTGQDCSSNMTYDTYSKINKGLVKNTVADILNTALLPQLRNNQGWQYGIIDFAWAKVGCVSEFPDEISWGQAFQAGRWQTYPQLVALLKAPGGCKMGAGVPPPAAPPPPQYVPANQMTAAYDQVWGALSRSVQMPSNCPVSAGAVSCARSNLLAYSKSNPGMINRIVPPVFQSVTGRAPNAAQAQSLADAYLITWSGADDLSTFLQRNRAAWQTQPGASSFHLDARGNVIDLAGRVLPNTMGSYLLGISAGRIVAQGGGNYQSRLGSTVVNVTAGSVPNLSMVLVDATGRPYEIVSQGAGNFQLRNSAGIVSQGAGNIVSQGAGNFSPGTVLNVVSDHGIGIVAQGGGNIVAQGGGNIVAQGGGNIVPQGAGNIVSQGAGNLTAANVAAYLSQQALFLAVGPGLLNPGSIANNLAAMDVAKVSSLRHP